MARLSGSVSDLVLAGALKLRQHFPASCAALSDRSDLLG
jgi:hypothetical protein